VRVLLVVDSRRDDLSTIVGSALRRSFTCGAVVHASIALWQEYLANGEPFVLVVADPSDQWSVFIQGTLAIKGAKVILLGRIPDRLQLLLNVTSEPLSPQQRALFSSKDAETNSFAESAAVVCYDKSNPLAAKAPMERRPCERFDFMAEWNNLGYGSIKADDSIWAISARVMLQDNNVIAQVLAEEQSITVYMGLWQIEGASLLWVNRAVGPVDSQEWFILEEFVSCYQADFAICLPVLSEIPHGYDACVTMRLDCDEDINSAHQLYALYQEKSVPLSLAIHGTVLEDDSHHEFLKQYVANGDCLLSHSWSHPVNWGDSYEETLKQVQMSLDAIEGAVGKEIDVKYAVSPFHQNPVISVQALADSGLGGFISGIICNDPEYLVARGGEVPFAPSGFVTHSQQCMLHGDCMLEGDDPLSIFKQSFDIARQGQALFGFLDHPFSPRYAYGWQSEDQRCEAHGEFIDYIKASGNVLFLNEHQALGWIAMKNSIELSANSVGEFSIKSSPSSPDELSLAVRYKNKNYDFLTWLENNSKGSNAV